ncbi:hypothetical protein [Roseomonas rosulenta]|uniref:hypothetical protein n=1 Tax=Roseomonas rosulenta TaxID=2748667 RepID=UPI0018DF47B5|nr:hypothetical protein [Roseomonas rosulenta]
MARIGGAAALADLADVDGPFIDTTYDTDGFWSGRVPTRLTVPAGITKVRLFGAAALDRGQRQPRRAHLQEWCSLRRACDFTAASGYTDADYSFGSTVVAVAAGDYFELQPYASATRTGDANEVQFAIGVVETADAATRPCWR